jgi:hypothetical protein
MAVNFSWRAQAGRACLPARVHPIWLPGTCSAQLQAPPACLQCVTNTSCAAAPPSCALGWRRLGLAGPGQHLRVSAATANTATGQVSASRCSRGSIAAGKPVQADTWWWCGLLARCTGVHLGTVYMRWVIGSMLVMFVMWCMEGSCACKACDNCNNHTSKHAAMHCMLISDNTQQSATMHRLTTALSHRLLEGDGLRTTGAGLSCVCLGRHTVWAVANTCQPPQ